MVLISGQETSRKIAFINSFERVGMHSGYVFLTIVEIGHPFFEKSMCFEMSPILFTLHWVL